MLQTLPRVMLAAAALLGACQQESPSASEATAISRLSASAAGGLSSSVEAGRAKSATEARAEPSSREASGTGSGDGSTDRAAVAGPARVAVYDDGALEGRRLSFWVALDGRYSAPVSVRYQTADGSARAGLDYEAASGTLTFAPGETRKSVVVSTRLRSGTQPTRSFQLLLSDPVNASLLDAAAVADVFDSSGALQPATAEAFQIDRFQLALVQRNLRRQDSPVLFADAKDLLALRLRLAVSVGCPAGASTPDCATRPDFIVEFLAESAEESLLLARRRFPGEQIAIRGVTGADRPVQIFDIPANTVSGFASLATRAGPSGLRLIARVRVADAGDRLHSAQIEAPALIALSDQLRFGEILVGGAEFDSLTPDASCSATPGSGFRVTGTARRAAEGDDEAGEQTVRFEAVCAELVSTASGDGFLLAVRSEPGVPLLARDDAARAAPGATVQIPVLLNDEGQAPLFVSVETPPSQGRVAVAGDGQLAFTAPDPFVGSLSFRYRLEDAAGQSAVATVAVTSTFIPNTAPVAEADTASTAFGSAVEIDVLANDRDPDGDRLRVSVLRQPAEGSAEVLADGRLRYQPRAGFFGRDTLRYRIRDGRGGQADARVLITVAPPPPQVSLGDLRLREPRTGQITAPLPVRLDRAAVRPVRVRYETVSGTATAGADFLAASGTIEIPAGQTTGSIPVTVLADAPVEPDEQFQVRLTAVTNGVIADGQAQIVIEDDSNALPEAVADTVSTPFDTAVEIDVLANDRDPDGDPLTVSILRQPMEGSVQLLAAGRLRYQPRAGFFGSDSLRYRIQDPRGGQAEAEVSIRVGEPTVQVSVADVRVREPRQGQVGTVVPVRLDRAAVQPVTVRYETVSGTATAGSDFLAATGAIEIAVGQSAGSIPVTVLADAAIEPEEQFLVRLIAVDNAVIADGEARVVVEEGSNRPPEAAADSAIVAEGGSVDINVLANDRDPDGDPLTLSVVQAPASGTLTLLPSQQFRYQSTLPSAPTVSFVYRVTDALGASADATVTLQVAQLPRASIGDAQAAEPRQNAQASTVVSVLVTLDRASTQTVTLGFDTVNDTALAGSDFIASRGTVQVPAGQTQAVIPITLLADAQVEGSERFLVRLRDAQNAVIADATATVTILDTVNRAPVAQADSAAVIEGGTVDINVLANDSDADGDALTVQIVSPPTNGTATVVAGGTIRYQSSLPSPATASFRYRVADAFGGSAEATVTINISPLPRISVGDASMAEPRQPTETTVVLVPVALDRAGAAPVTVSFETLDDVALAGSDYLATSGTVTLAAGQTQATIPVTLLGDRVIESTERFVVRLSSPQGGVLADANAFVAIVENSNRPPVAQADSASVLAGAFVDINVLANDSDADGDSLAVTLETAPATGTATVVAGNLIRYQSVDPSPSPVTFSYRVSDGVGESAVALVTVTVQPQPPVVSIVNLATFEPDGFGSGTAPVSIELRLSRAASGPSTTVDYSFQDGTATAGADYTATLSGTVTFAAGATSATIPATILGDLQREPTPETFQVVLGNPQNLTLDPQASTATVSITDAPPPDLSAIDVAAVEPSTGTRSAGIPVRLSAPAVGDVRVDYLRLDGSAAVNQDYAIADSGFVTIPRGQVEALIPFTILSDTVNEFNENFLIRISTPVSGVNVIRPEATVVILNGTVNQAPVAVDDRATVTAGGSVIIPVLANDSDGNGDPLIVSAIVTAPSHGIVEILADNTLRYTETTSGPTSDFFVYEIDDGFGGSAQATVTISIDLGTAGPQLPGFAVYAQQRLQMTQPASTVTELYRVFFDTPGGSLRITPEFPFGDPGVHSFRLSPDGRFVIYLADNPDTADTGDLQLFQIELSSCSPQSISQPCPVVPLSLPSNPLIDGSAEVVETSDLQFSSEGSAVYYLYRENRLAPDQISLYRSDLGQGVANGTRLLGTSAGLITEFQVDRSPAFRDAVLLSLEEQVEPFARYLARVGGLSEGPVQRLGTPFLDGGVLSQLQQSPDGNWVTALYARSSFDPAAALFGVNTAANPDVSLQLTPDYTFTCGTGYAQFAPYRFSADSGFLYFAADAGESFNASGEPVESIECTVNTQLGEFFAGEEVYASDLASASLDVPATVSRLSRPRPEPLIEDLMRSEDGGMLAYSTIGDGDTRVVALLDLFNILEAPASDRDIDRGFISRDERVDRIDPQLQFAAGSTVLRGLTAATASGCARVFDFRVDLGLIRYGTSVGSACGQGGGVRLLRNLREAQYFLLTSDSNEANRQDLSLIDTLANDSSPSEFLLSDRAASGDVVHIEVFEPLLLARAARPVPSKTGGGAQWHPYAVRVPWRPAGAGEATPPPPERARR
ncbi:MAG TPA: Ig-like domain-containing protein [Nevskiaceae bacterium]|nr:Ig-like domain-containing protein [Nevskiaceae bacterium]